MPPRKLKREDILTKPRITLGEVASLIENIGNFTELFHTPPEKWGSYFQSPVNKEAWTFNDSFGFDELGAFKNTDEAHSVFLKWLGVEEGDKDYKTLKHWLSNGWPIDSALMTIQQKLYDESLTNHSLYNQLICRLVHVEQLRRDPDYQCIYQIPPGDYRLMDTNDSPKAALRSLELAHKEVKRNQKMYWGISEIFQSLVAMFDSDLGSYEKLRNADLIKFNLPKSTRGTREFIRIQEAGKKSKILGPAKINYYSPLRYWAPPPAFARCVFNMLFWRAVITGNDLFNRDVIRGKASVVEDESKVIDARAECYYVIVNSFNAGKYRIAHYNRLLRALLTIAKEFDDNDKSKPLCELSDVEFSKDKGKEIFKQFYPEYFLHTNVTYQEFPSLRVSMPFKGAYPQGSTIWELAHIHHDTDHSEDPTTVSDLLKFLRDKALELILWSKFQMEIRSVGIIPVQNLYAVQLTPKGRDELNKLRKKYLQAKSNKKNSAELLRSINKTVSEAIKGPRGDKSVPLAIEECPINDWVEFRKVYGGTYRDLIDKERLSKINPFTNSNSNSNQVISKSKKEKNGEETKESL